ncbi:MAG: Polysaccharide deacetylase [Syntrophorhabdus sp. PtaU1.Bin153]|nr:MAG: Polysaccharide deacetylase [Syntrophorhabdus sp. PtaU1.Bin153]
MWNRLKTLAVNSRISSFTSKLLHCGIGIYRYHSVQENPADYENLIGPTIIHSEEVFKRQIEFLATHYKILSFNEGLSQILGEKPSGKRSVMITFDDGFVDNFRVALPILKALGVPAIFFVTAGAVESREPPWFCRVQNAFRSTKEKVWHDSLTGVKRPLTENGDRSEALLAASRRIGVLTDGAQGEALALLEKDLQVSWPTEKGSLMMTWEDVRKLVHDGYEVGSHSLSHPNLARVNDMDRLRAEIVTSKHIIEDKIQTEVRGFSYPNPIFQPHWDDTVLEFIRQSGYQLAFTSVSGMVRQKDNPYTLRRLWAPLSFQEFCWVAETACFR